jgi:hypothetical protein
MRVACQGLNRDFGISVQGSVRDVNYTAKLGDIEVSIPVLSRDTNTPRIEAPCYPSTSHCWLAPVLLAPTAPQSPPCFCPWLGSSTRAGSSSGHVDPCQDRGAPLPDQLMETCAGAGPGARGLGQRHRQRRQPHECPDPILRWVIAPTNIPRIGAPCSPSTSQTQRCCHQPRLNRLRFASVGAPPSPLRRRWRSRAPCSAVHPHWACQQLRPPRRLSNHRAVGRGAGACRR